MKLNDSKSPSKNVKGLIIILLFLFSCTYSPEPPPDVTEPKASETPDCITTCLELYEDARMALLIAMKFYAVGKNKNHRVFNERQVSRFC
jgi:hypothetical protein